MGELSEFSLPTRLFLKTYRWRRIDPIPWTALKKPISQSRLALVSSAGLVQKNQEPFNERMPGGDFTFREISDDIEVRQLIDTHRSGSFDHGGLRQDPNLVFPLDRLRELREQGRIGSINQRHLSFMGSITAPGRLITQTAPEAARKMVEDGVDAALLVPV
jgi:D-proline reductase (dithiol) PrdB